jgi:hypothetical protein
MLLEVKVVPVQFTSPQVLKQRETTWSTTQTARFVCDQARVERVSVTRTRRRGDKVLVEVTPQLATTWFRQDVDLTVTLLRADGTEVAKRTWDDLTIGNQAGSGLVFGSSTKRPTLEIEMNDRDFLALFADDQRPTVRVIVDIQDDNEEGEDEQR